MDDEKEVYRLWIEYLKRSVGYFKYCDFLRSKEPHATFKEIDWKNVAGLAYSANTASRYLVLNDADFWAATENIQVSELSVNHKNSNVHYSFRLYYTVFGDVFRRNFNDIWDNYLSSYTASIKKYAHSLDYNAVKIYTGSEFEEISSYFIPEFVWDNGKNTSENLHSYIKHLSMYVVEKDDSGIVLCSVDLRRGKTAIVKSMNSLLDKIIDKSTHNSDMFMRYISPASNIYNNELSRYLRLYDLKQDQKSKKSNRDIFKQIYPDLRVLDVSEMALGRARACKELKYAERIIKNVEHGLFPGPYAKAKGGCDHDLK